MEQKSPTTRTRWAEQSVSAFLSIPLISEFVFHSPQTIDGTQREVADFLISYGEPGLLISQKCQENPASRTPERNEAWVRKTVKEGVRQLCGALRTGKGKLIWCDHARRGRVEFAQGLPPIARGIVLVESFQPVVLNGSADELPLDYMGTPISYFSVNDFLNVTLQLRTLPEIVEYLDRRRGLPWTDLRTIGEENSLFGFYLLNDGSLDGCLSIADARITVAAQAKRLKEVLGRKSESDSYSTLLEHVANELASRLPNYQAGLSPQDIAAFDPEDKRQNYLELQRVLADLRLRERAELGAAFESTGAQLANVEQGFVYRAAFLDSRPDWVYVVAASKKIERSEIISRISILSRAAMSQYGKSRSFVVINRDGEGYEVGLSRPEFKPTVTDCAAGESLFGRLKVEDRPLHLVP
jgi:hypothetical protein